MNNKIIIQFFSVLASVLLLQACSGGETGTGVNEPPPGTEQKAISVGRITGFGADNVSVNGIEYFTGDSSIILDDVAGVPGDLEIGMIVAIQGKVNQDSLTGDASQIIFKDVVEGVVTQSSITADSNGSGSINVLGQIVVLDSLTAFDSNDLNIQSPDQISNGHVVEISGFTSGNGTIYATRVELKDLVYTEGNEIEVKGNITVLTGNTFAIGTLIIDYSAAQINGFQGNGLQEGLFVEVKSNTALNNQGQFLASIVEFEQATLQVEESTNLKLEGIVTSVITPGSEFVLNGQLISISETTVFVNGSVDDLVEERTIMVQGTIDINGIVSANNILFIGSVDISIDAYVESINVDTGSLVVLGRTISIDNLTTMKDKRDRNGYDPVRNFKLIDLEAGNRVKININEITSMDFVASKLERKDIVDTEVELEGRLDLIEGTDLIVAGVKIDASAVDLARHGIEAGGLVKIKGTFDVANQVIVATDVKNRSCKWSWYCW